MHEVSYSGGTKVMWTHHFFPPRENTGEYKSLNNVEKFSILQVNLSELLLIEKVSDSSKGVGTVTSTPNSQCSPL